MTRSLKTAAALAVFVIGAGAHARTPTDARNWQTITQYGLSPAGSVTSGDFTGTCGDNEVIVDRNGMVGCTNVSDVAPIDIHFSAINAFPGGTQDPADTHLSAGFDELKITITDFTSCATDVVTMTTTVDGVLVTRVCTEDGTSTGTGWDDATGNNETATSLALCINRSADVSATAVAAVVRIVPGFKLAAFTIASASDCLTETAGTSGVLQFHNDTLPGADSLYDIGSATRRVSIVFLDTLGDSGQTLNVGTAIMSFDAAAEINGSGNAITFGDDVFFANGTTVGIGHTSLLTIGAGVVPTQIVGTSGSDSKFAVARFSSANAGPEFIGLRSANITPGSFTSVADGDITLTLLSRVDDGTTYNVEVGAVEFKVDDSTVGTGAIGGSVGFRTSTTGGTLTTAMLIDSLQDVTFKPSTALDVLLKTGGGDLQALATLVTGLTSAVPDAGPIVLFNMPTTVGGMSDGDELSAQISLGEKPVLTFFSESDGAGTVDTIETRFHGTNGFLVKRRTAETTLTFAASPGETSVTSAAGFIPDGALSLTVSGRVIVAGVGCTSFDAGDVAGTPDVDAFGAGLALTVGTTFDSTDWTATVNYNQIVSDQVRLTRVGADCEDLSVRIVISYELDSAATQ